MELGTGTCCRTGMSGAEILSVLLDLTPEGREAPPSENGSQEQEPGTLEMLARAMLGAPRYVERVLRATPSTLPNLEDTPILGDIPGAQTLGRLSARFARTIRARPSRVLERTNLTPPRTSFNGRVSAHRRFAFGRLGLADVKAVKNAHGCTVNDVVVAICAGAVRRWLIEHDELPDTPLVAQIPVSVRTEEQFGTYGNRIGMLAAPIFLDLSKKGKLLSLSFWRDADSVKNWREQAEHRVAQQKGRAEIFADYRISVVAVERQYGMYDRKDAPQR